MFNFVVNTVKSLTTKDRNSKANSIPKQQIVEIKVSRLKSLFIVQIINGVTAIPTIFNEEYCKG